MTLKQKRPWQPTLNLMTMIWWDACSVIRFSNWLVAKMSQALRWNAPKTTTLEALSKMQHCHMWDQCSMAQAPLSDRKQSYSTFIAQFVEFLNCPLTILSYRLWQSDLIKAVRALYASFREVFSFSNIKYIPVIVTGLETPWPSP